MSDSHWLIKDQPNRKTLTDKLVGGPILVHAGDVSGRGTIPEIEMFLEWFNSLPYDNKILIAGNHDFLFETKPEKAAALLAKYPGIIYLNDSGCTVEGINFWGSPITPYFHNWAFNRFSHEIQPHWDLIPEGTDVLITHGPPHGILDLTVYDRKSVGCPKLLTKVKQIKPKVHVFGHIHEGMGVHEEDGTTFINASVVDLRYELYDQPIFSIDVNPREHEISKID
jgi:predicted phosphohydrolase